MLNSMSRYSVVIETSARNELKRLPRDMAERLLIKIASLREEPRPGGVRKIAGSERTWRVRVRDYRVIYEIDDRESVVTVFRVRLRDKAYD